MLAITDSWNSVHNYALKQQGVSKGRHFIQPIRQDQRQGQRGIVNSRPSKRIIRQRTRPRSRIWMLVLTIRAKAMQGLACVVLFWFTFKWCSYCYFTLLFSTHSVTVENLSHRNSFFSALWRNWGYEDGLQCDAVRHCSSQYRPGRPV